MRSQRLETKGFQYIAPFQLLLHTAHLKRPLPWLTGCVLNRDCNDCPLIQGLIKQGQHNILPGRRWRLIDHHDLVAAFKATLGRQRLRLDRSDDGFHTGDTDDED